LHRGENGVKSLFLILLQNPLLFAKPPVLQIKTVMISIVIFFKNPAIRGFAAESILDFVFDFW
jgi:hypothetical protein